MFMLLFHYKCMYFFLKNRMFEQKSAKKYEKNCAPRNEERSRIYPNRLYDYCGRLRVTTL